MEQVLVVGGGGFIGRAVAEKLSQCDDRSVTVLVRTAARGRPLAAENIPTVIGNLNRGAGLDRALQGKNVVINLAYDFKVSGQANLAAFDRLIDKCVQHGIRRVIHISSIVVYDDWPDRDISEESAVNSGGSEYRQTKIAMEKRLRERRKEMDFVILQPTIVYGPRSWLWTDLIAERLSTGTVVLPERCDGLANLVFVDDVADAVLLAIDSEAAGGNTYIVSGSDTVTWREYFKAYDNLLGTDSLRFEPLEAKAVESDTRSGFRQFLANPLSAANWKIVRVVLNSFERLFGDRFISGLKALVLKLKGGAGRIVYYPSTGDIILYAGEGRAVIERARADLGYEPVVDFASGFRKTAGYLKRTLTLAEGSR